MSIKDEVLKELGDSEEHNINPDERDTHTVIDLTLKKVKERIKKIRKANYRAFKNSGELTQQQIDRYYHRFRLCDELLKELDGEKS